MISAYLQCTAIDNHVNVVKCTVEKMVNESESKNPALSSLTNGEIVPIAIETVAIAATGT